MIKICYRCKKKKSLNDYHKNAGRKSGLADYCKYCANLINRTRHKKLRDKQRKSGLCIQGCCKKKPEKGHYRCSEHLMLIKDWRKKIKVSCFMLYGGCFCICCDESNIDFLTMDHVKDNGKEEREKEPEQAKNIYHWLKKKQYPKGYQVLCANCQLGKKINKGFCPHHPKTDLRKTR